MGRIPNPTIEIRYKNDKLLLCSELQTGQWLSGIIHGLLAIEFAADRPGDALEV